MGQNANRGENCDKNALMKPIWKLQGRQQDGNKKATECPVLPKNLSVEIKTKTLQIGRQRGPIEPRARQSTAPGVGLDQNISVCSTLLVVDGMLILNLPTNIYKSSNN